MLAYLQSFKPEDQVRIFRFLATFSRWECALKHNGYVEKGNFGEAVPCWTKFATDHEGKFAALKTQEFIKAREVLLSKPPKREMLKKNPDSLVWEDNPRRPNEANTTYLLRIVRDVRNNLFHGGKFVGGPVQELARDQLLIDSALTILEVGASTNEGIKRLLNSE